MKRMKKNILLCHTERTYSYLTQKAQKFRCAGLFVTRIARFFFSIRMKRMKKNILLCHSDGTNPLISIRF